jgi:hypothetical protein
VKLYISLSLRLAHTAAVRMVELCLRVSSAYILLEIRSNHAILNYYSSKLSGPNWIFGYLDIWIFGYLDIWIIGYYIYLHRGQVFLGL